MKIFLSALFIFASVSAFAQKENVSFTYFGNEGGRRSFYACDFVEYQTEKYLKLFGATSIEVYCTGGINHGHISPVSVRAKFETPRLMGNEVTVTQKVQGDSFNPACGINVAIIKNL